MPLETLARRFASSPDGQLTGSDLARMLKYIRPDLKDRQLEHCLFQVWGR